MKKRKRESLLTALPNQSKSASNGERDPSASRNFLARTSPWTFPSLGIFSLALSAGTVRQIIKQVPINREKCVRRDTALKQNLPS